LLVCGQKVAKEKTNFVLWKVTLRRVLLVYFRMEEKRICDSGRIRMDRMEKAPLLVGYELDLKKGSNCSHP
jgi:hypothetical protein